jgi:ERCC4-type nuclease
MKLVVDERETTIYEKIQQLLTDPPETQSALQVVKEVLPLGDFIIKTTDDRTVAIVERKSLADLLASIKDSRYEEQSYRLSNSDEFSPSQVIYIIEGALNTLRTPKERRLVYSVITSLHFFKGFRPLRTSSYQETAELLVAMTDKIARNLQRGVPLFRGEPANTNPTHTTNEENPRPVETAYCSVVKKVKKENITQENIGEIMLCQVPGISAVTAVAIMKHFTSFYHLLESCKNDPKCLENMKYESGGKMRKISKSSIASIYKFFLTPNPDENG